MRSMTGYGQAVSSELQSLQWVVEIHGVNRKMLDVTAHLPKDMLYFELEIRQRLSRVVDRGQITVRAYLKQMSLQGKNNTPYLDALRTLQSTWIHLAAELGYSKEEIDLPFLLDRLDRSSLEELPMNHEKLLHLLESTLDQAIKDFLDMKKTEGKRLGSDLHKRFTVIAQYVEQVEREALQTHSKFYNKLKDLIQELIGSKPIEDERILREVALYAEKADITEEITRLYSHLKQSFSLLEEEKKSVGRPIEFLAQEMQREIATISAKSSSLEIINLTLLIKAELEKIREQAQNIE